jgi:tRNA (cmo5U34)-methyltransferase
MVKRTSRKIDRLYSTKLKTIPEFRFDRGVADVFDDMIVRSVPLYSELQRMIVELAVRFVQKRSNIYDLGCATGTTLSLLSRAVPDPTVRFYGIDSSKEMLRKAEAKLAGLKGGRFSLVCQDLNSLGRLTRPSVAIMAFTLQFIQPLNRRIIVASVHDSLRANGCLILTEKVLGADNLMTRLMGDLHHDFKRRNRYSQLEIAQKRQALENFLVPYRLDDIIRLLYDCGFPVVEIFFKWFNFAGLIAVKARP